MKTKPFGHQTTALERSHNKKNFAYFMEMGCVDGDTEFLTNRGWIAFKDFDLSKWKRPLLVAQCTKHNFEEQLTTEFVPPTSFVKKKADKWFHITAQGLDMMVTDCHDVVGRYSEGIFNKFCFGEKPGNLHKYSDFRVPTTLSRYEGIYGYTHKKKPAQLLTPEQMRVMVAVIADGHFPNVTDDRCIIELRKQRKIDRLHKLLKKAGITYVVEERTSESVAGQGVFKFQFIAPIRKKIYDNDFWLCDAVLKSAIFHEFPHWDGSLPTKAAPYTRFYSTEKQSIDFIQYVCAIHGATAQICGREYQNSKNTKVCYTVRYGKSKANSEELVLGKKIKDIVEIEEENTAYCLRVPSGMLLLRRNGKIFVTGNSGKTKVMIDNMAYLYAAGHITGAIILAPKGVYRNWSEKEIPDHLADEIQRDVYVWKADAAKSYKMKLKEEVGTKGDKLKILVYNVESLISEEGRKVIDKFVKTHQGNLFICMDESTCIKNPKAKRTKAACLLSSQCKIRRIATGSPVTNSPLDLFSQCAFLDIGILGAGSFYAFRNRYAVTQKMQTRVGAAYDKILCYKNLDDLARRLKDFSYRVTKKECLDLPDKIFVTRDVELTPEQVKVYKEMSEHLFATYNQAEMSAQITLTKMLRLHQVLCGSFIDDDGNVHKLPNKRIDALMECLEETDGKVIIWANYISNIEDIVQSISQKYGEDSVVTYYGATPAEDRVRAIQLFQDDTSPCKFFVGNVQTAGRGITLTAASTCIYFSNNFSLEMRQQSEDRAHRFGQKNNVTYIDFVVPKSMDEKVIKSLLEKRDIANTILEDGELESWIKL